MKRLPLADLIVKKGQPLLTLELLDAYQNHPDETVETYIFTENIRSHFEQILESVARGVGQGFWVQAEYGAGKTHFLACLAALLSDTSDELWSKATDDEVRQYQRRVKNLKLLPVVFSLRGEASAGSVSDRSLMDVLLDQGFRSALKRAGLGDRVKLTSAEDLIDWYDHKASQAIKTEFESYVQRATRTPLSAHRQNEGIEAVAGLLSKYLESISMKPEIAVGVKDRLASIYSQLTATGGPGYMGVLVVIDEYEGWSTIRQDSAEARAQDEDLLETLGYLLPKDLGMAVHTIVASQSAVPAKLHGGQEGDRFINLPLLADQNSRDYDIIASRRVRGLHGQRLPEISDYYRYYAETFDFARQLREDDFRETFPFQPRCFEIVRRITSRDLPGPRSGIRILYEVINDEPLLARDTLIRAGDLMRSRHLVEDCLTKVVYKKHLDAYRLASDALPSLDLEAADLDLARNILSTLYLWHEAYLDRPRPMPLKDLAEATLTTGDVIKAEDNVAYLLSQMQALQQIQFDNQTAQFIPAGEEGLSPITLFKENVRRAQQNRYAVLSALTNSLFFTAAETHSQPGLFAEFEIDKPANRSFEYRNLQYQGEVVVASRGQMDWDVPRGAEDVHFRIALMTPDAAQSVKSSDLRDPRVAVVYPASPSDEAMRAAAEYVAWSDMWNEYKDQPGKDAETVREWLLSQRNTYVSNLLQTHLGLYRAGQIVTRDDLGIAAKEAFGAASNDRRLSFIVEKLLANGYPHLPVEPSALRSTLTATEAGKVFEGYFGKNPGPAQTTATRNYGVGLGFSTLDRPADFAPVENNRALSLIQEMLEEQKGGELPVWKLYERLSQPPFGLPYVVVQLYLLAFVYRGNPRADLLLKRDHRLKTRDGKSYTRDRITAATIKDIQWRPGMHSAFDVLVPAAGPTWNDVLPYARELLEDLRATTDQDEIETEGQRLSERLASLGEEVGKQRAPLSVLERKLGASLPSEAQKSFERLTGLAQLQNGYASFFEKAEEMFGSADELRNTMRTYYRMRELASIAAEVTEVKGYLDDLRLRDRDRELAAQKISILGQIDLGHLAEQPSAWGRIRAQFDQLKARYRNEYQKHHRDTNAALSKLGDSLADAPRQLNALKLLNGIHELGPARGEDLGDRHEQLKGAIRPCSVDFQAVSIDAAPACTECRRDLTYVPPTEQVEFFRRDLEAALADQQRRLASEAIRRVLEHGKGDALSKFVQAAQAANLAALVDLLDENIVKVIRKLLAEEQIGVAESDVIGKFLRQYGSLEEADIPAAVQAFETLLREAFKEARKTNKGKKSIRLTLK